MKMIIDIPKKVVRQARSYVDFPYEDYGDYGMIVAQAIKNGTPLPKGHGRLIDAEQAEEQLRQALDEHEGYNSLARYIVRNPSETPTIIEADKGEQG